MLESLLLKDFQVHKRLSLKFEPGINVLIGENDVGKSAILRAIEWILLNYPSGTSFINWDAERVYGELILDGNSLKRIKGKSNLYILNGAKFKAFGNTVPEQIAKLVNTHEATFQNQHDSLYWIAEPAGSISKKLNEIVDLTTIDNSLAFIGLEAKRAKQQEVFIHNRLNLAKHNTKDLKYSIELDGDVTSLEKLNQHLKQLVKNRLRLVQLVKTGVRLTRKVERANNRLPDVLKSINLLKQYKVKYSVKAAKLKALRSLIWQIQNLETNLKARKANLAQLQVRIETARKEFRTCPVCFSPMQ